MTTNRLVFVLALLLSGFSLPAAQLYRLEGKPYRASATIVWSDHVTNWPSVVTVYKVLPQKFPKQWLSNVLVLTKFAGTPEASGDSNRLSWRYKEHGTLERSLDVAPVYGYIDFHDYKVTAVSTNLPVGVPNREEVDALALRCFQRLGGDTNELCLKHRSGTERRQRRIDRKTRKYADEFVTMRGVMYARQIAGIRFVGAGGRGGFAVDFGPGTNIASLELDWRRLEPYQSYRTLNRDDIVKAIMVGKAVISTENGEMPENPIRLTISQVTPYYMSEISGKPEGFVFPIANIEMRAEMAGSNTATFYLDCPIISEEP